MFGRTFGALKVAMILFILTECDSFSILGQFEKALSLDVQSHSVRPGEQNLLYPAGGTEPYFFYVLVDDLYDNGQPTDPGSVTNQSYTAGLSVGRVKIRVTDGAGDSDEVIVTILPWKPGSFMVDGTAIGPTTIRLNWTYDLPGYIGGFRILRSIGGGAFIQIANPGSIARTFLDTSASPQRNIYRLYATAGPYLSTYIEESGFGIP